MKKTFLCLFAAGLCLNALAETLSPEEALARVTASSPMKLKSSLPATQKPLLTTYCESYPATYIFSNGDGYAVVAADDVAEPLLGYCDEGSLDVANLPDNMRYWLNEYGRQIAWARSNGITPNRIARSNEYPAIAPIAQTRWSQGSPYNNECPEISGQRAITGCVATAMAQVMKVHNWPLQGEGRHSYYCNALHKSINMVFERTTFDWDNMLDRYGGSASDAQKLAVATLMKACGYSVDMDYTTGACGAQSFNVAVALPKYFKYDNGVKYLLRDFYGASEWDDLIYSELKEGRAVYYSGANNEAGHAFVCDGYDGNGYFHINWGWSGQSDGYFLLNGLDPSSQGLGGSNAGYNSWQEVICNVKPRDDDNPSPSYKWMGAYDFNVESNEVNLGEEVNVTSWFYNYAIESLEGTFGLKLVSTADDKVIYLTDGNKFKNLGVRSGKSAQVVLPADLAEGAYKMTVGFTDVDGIWHDCRIAKWCHQEYDLTVAAGKAKLQACAAPAIKVKDVTCTPLYVNSTFRVNANMVNEYKYDFYKGVYMSIRDGKGNEIYATETLRTDMDGNSTKEWMHTGRLTINDGATVDYDADYYLYFFDDEDYSLSEGIKVKINPDSKPVVNFGEMTVVGDYELDRYGPTGVDPHNLHIVMDVECESGYFAEELYMWIFSWTSQQGATGYAVYGFPADLLMLNAGEKSKAVFKTDFNNAGEKSRYIGLVWYNGSYLENGAVFRTGVEESGIGGVVEEAQPVSVRIFNLEGREMTNPNLHSGVYIIVATDAAGNQETRKVVIK